MGVWPTAWVLLGLLLAGELAAQGGQYRSRVMIDPNATLDKTGQRSVDQLEQHLGALVDPSARASAGRHLARHYLQSGEYDKAEEYYLTALGADGLSPVANREMLRELARVYLLQKDWQAAADSLQQVLQFELDPEPEDFLQLASALHGLGDYVAVVATLDRLQDSKLPLDATGSRRAVALYYAAGAYPQAAALLRQLLLLEPGNPDNWHQLAALYLLQNQRREALDLLSLARDKGVPFGEQNTLLLADLQASEKTPYLAASTLQQALHEGTVAASGAHYRKLFEFWLQARETRKSALALAEAARLTGDTELYLHLAQLQMDSEDWQSMQQTVLLACVGELEDRHVGRANLLLGISQLKLDDPESARRSFINATLIGGAGQQAGQWLDFMEAAPATEDEARRIVSPCYGKEDKRMAVAIPEAAALGAPNAMVRDTATSAVVPMQVKTIPPRQFLASAQTGELLHNPTPVKSLLLRMNMALARGGGAADGPAELHFNAPLINPDTPGAVQLVLPVRGAARAGGRFKLLSTEAFPCLWERTQAAAGTLPGKLTEFAARAQAQGHRLSGELRLLLLADNGETSFEIQLGIQP